MAASATRSEGQQRAVTLRCGLRDDRAHRDVGARRAAAATSVRLFLTRRITYPPGPVRAYPAGEVAPVPGVLHAALPANHATLPGAQVVGVGAGQLDAGEGALFRASWPPDMQASLRGQGASCIGGSRARARGPIDISPSACVDACVHACMRSCMCACIGVDLVQHRF